MLKGAVFFMSIGFIGAGKVGVSLGKYLTTHRIELSGYYSSNLNDSKSAANFTNSKAYFTLEELVNNAQILLLTVPDNKIECVWNDISKFNIKNKVICHTSGSISSKIFNDIEVTGAYGYSIHPMFAFSDIHNSYKNLKGAYFSIEGDKKYIQHIKNFLECLDVNTFIMDENNKPLYHAANVTASNLVLSLLKISCGYLEDCGLDEAEALKALSPLILNNIESIFKNGFKEALTGPIERNDTATILHHLSSIPKKDVLLYKRLSMELIEIAQEKHKNRNYIDLINILGGGI